jgi:hypothetical protein
VHLAAIFHYAILAILGAALLAVLGVLVMDDHWLRSLTSRGG